MGIRDLVALFGVRKGTERYRRVRAAYWSLRAMRSPRSYSQYGEDVMMLSMLDGGIGTYVDVGAGQPIRGSNTYAFYKMGWAGVLIDPVARNVKDLRLIRRRDRVIHALCGASAGKAQVFEYEAYEYTTTSLERVRELKFQGLEPVATYSLPVVPLSTLGLDAKPRDPSLLSIDVEGGELNSLIGNDWERYLPAIVCVEEWQSPLEEPTDVRSFLEERGYVLRSYSCLSSVYVHLDARSS